MEEAGRARVLGLRVKAVSKEAPGTIASSRLFLAQHLSNASMIGNKAANVCDLDQRSAWSSGTTAKEWIILELCASLAFFFLKGYSMPFCSLDALYSYSLPLAHLML